MPASSFNSYLQEARNNFDAVRPAPICMDANQTMGQCHNVHISTNCYYGYHDLKGTDRNHIDNDCEMLEVELPPANEAPSQPPSRKRSADSRDYPQSKRLREEGMVPSTSNFNPCLLRPTHNNPDITRCLMVHMI